MVLRRIFLLSLATCQFTKIMNYYFSERIKLLPLIFSGENKLAATILMLDHV